MSDELLQRLKAENIDALISVVGGRGLGILHKLHRKGLHTVCIPKSIENDIAATSISFGFNSALSFTIEMLMRAKQAAKSARKSPWWRSLAPRQDGWRCRPASPSLPMRCCLPKFNAILTCWLAGSRRESHPGGRTDW